MSEQTVLVCQDNSTLLLYKEKKMSKLMDWFRAELATVKLAEITPINDKVEPNDLVIGVITCKELQKMWFLLEKALDELQEAAKNAREKMPEIDQDLESFVTQAREKYPDDECKEMCIFLANCVRRVEFLKHLFWRCVEEELSEEALAKLRFEPNGGIGLRDNWQMVLLPQEEPPVHAIILPGGILFN